MAAISRMMSVTSWRASHTNSKKVLGFLGGIKFCPNTCLRFSRSAGFPDRPEKEKRVEWVSKKKVEELNGRGRQLKESFKKDPLLPNLPKYEIQLGRPTTPIFPDSAGVKWGQTKTIWSQGPLTPLGLQGKLTQTYNFIFSSLSLHQASALRVH